MLAVGSEVQWRVDGRRGLYCPAANNSRRERTAKVGAVSTDAAKILFAFA